MNILLIEDNPGDARLVQEILKEVRGDFTISVAEKLGQALELLPSQDVDAVLLDLNLPDSHGLETITTLQTRFPHMPIVVMTSIDDEELAHQAVRLGAQDYIVKGNVNGELLRRTLMYAIERKQAEEALRKAHDELELRVVKRTADLMRSNEELEGEIAHRMRAEEQIRRLNRELEQRVAERTAELQAANASLRDSRRAALNLMEDSVAARREAEDAAVVLQREAAERKQAETEILKLSEDMAARNVELEEANKDLESFIYSISHDLRAPLRHIGDFAKILAEDYFERFDDQGKDYLRRIRNGSEKMKLLIDDLLNLSKISRQEIRRVKIDVSELAKSIVSELRGSDPGRNVEIVITEGLEVFVDPRLVEIVLLNLLGNAWKFTSKTEAARIEFGKVEEDGRIVYYVKDNGAGFDPNFADKMFWPFHRLHSDKEFPGTGIGLTIVERIIRRHGGKVWAEGETGKGTTVYFTLG